MHKPRHTHLSAGHIEPRLSQPFRRRLARPHLALEKQVHPEMLVPNVMVIGELIVVPFLVFEKSYLFSWFLLKSQAESRAKWEDQDGRLLLHRNLFQP